MSGRGKKRNLPNGWIVVNSKTHPDRVYYFNVKTNQSAWEEPVDEDEASTTIPLRQREKLVTQDKAVHEGQSDLCRAKTPELCSKDNVKNVKRRILSPKRRLKNPTSQPLGDKQTPQMKAIMEKIMQRESKSLTHKLPSAKSVKDVDKRKSSAGSTSGNTETDSVVKGACTPQMRAILEKMKQKPDKSCSGKKVKENSSSTGVSTSHLDTAQQSLRVNKATTSSSSAARSIGSASTECMYDTKTTDNKKAAIRSTNINKKKKTKPKIGGKVQKAPKNIAKKRLAELRRSLQEEQDKVSQNTKSNECRDVEAVENQDESPPNAYQNADTRLRRLRVKLLKDYATEYKKTQRNKSGDEGNSVADNMPSTETLIQQCMNDSFQEDMEWESIPDEQITHEVNNIRIQLCMAENDNTKTSIPQNAFNIVGFPKEIEKDPLYIVVDTNVFLANLQLVEEARDFVFKHHGTPTIVIPWTVIRELDYLKNSKTNDKPELRAKARRSINFLHEHFASKHPRVLGQTLADVRKNKEKYATDCPDDEILQTCLQVRECGKTVVLLSYDKNLCNKAMIHDVMILERNEPLEKIDYLTAGPEKNASAPTLRIKTDDKKAGLSSLSMELRVADEIFESVTNTMKSILSTIVAKEMKDLFGENWENYTIVKPPWTIEGVLKCTIKHWIAAVNESFHRRAEPLMKELLPAFTKLPAGGRRMSHVTDLLELCSDVIQLIHIGKHPDLMTNAFRSIDELKKRISEFKKMMRQRNLENTIGLESSIEKQVVRANKTFDYFEEIYNYSMIVCSVAAKKCGMPFFFNPDVNVLYDENSLNGIQHKLNDNISGLIDALRLALEQVKDSNLDSRSLNCLYDTLVNFLPEDRITMLTKKHDFVLEPLDVYCCLLHKQQLLEAGLGQLHELRTHFCRLATYRISS